jgi:hypothetical protein
MFCAPRVVSRGTEGVRSRFQVLRSKTRFRRYRGRRVLFSCFACTDSFLAYRGCRVPFLCFARSNMFSVVPRASRPVFMFCAHGLIFYGAECAGSCFHVLCALVSFSTVQRATGSVFMFCAPRIVFGGTEGVGSRYHVLRAWTHFWRKRGRRLPFLTVSGTSALDFRFCVPELIFGGTEGVRSHFHVLRFRTHFRRCREYSVPFSCFALQDMFSAVPSASGPVFMFCAPGLVFGGPKGDGSHFHVLRAGTSFWRYGGRRVRQRTRTRLRRYRGRRVSFACFVRPNTFATETMVPTVIFMFCAPGIVSRGTEGVGSRFHVLCSRTHFRRYCRHRVPFSCFACPDLFPTVKRASDSIF